MLSTDGNERGMAVYVPDENGLALKTDAELVALSEAVLEHTIAGLEDMPLDDAFKTRLQNQTIAKILARHIEDVEARREAARNLTEARIRIERQMGEMLAPLEAGRPAKWSAEVTIMPRLTDLAVTKNQSSLWQRMARATEEKTEGYFARTRAKPPVSARRSSPTAPPRSARPGASGSVFFRV